MALRTWILAGTLAAFSLGAMDAFGAGRQKYQFKNPACAIKVAKGKTWEGVDRVWKEGEWVLGAPASSRGDVLYIFHQGKTYATPADCWVNSSGSRLQASVSQSFGLMYVTWQEQLEVDSASGGSGFVMRGNQSGWAVSYSRDVKSWQRWRVGWTGAAISAASTVRTSTTGVAQISCPTCAAFGVMVLPEVDWRRQGEGPAIGLGFPIVARMGNWSPPAGYVTNSNFRVLLGPVLSVRLLRPGWEVSSRLGFLSSSENLAWFLGVSRVL